MAESVLVEEGWRTPGSIMHANLKNLNWWTSKRLEAYIF